MGDPIIEERVETGISEHDFHNVSRRRVPVENNLDVFFENFQHMDEDTLIISMEYAARKSVSSCSPLTAYCQRLTERALHFSPARDLCRACNRCYPPGPASLLR